MQDFATSSLKGEVVAENEENVELDDLEQYEIDSRKQWEQRYSLLRLFTCMSD